MPEKGGQDFIQCLSYLSFQVATKASDGPCSRSAGKVCKSLESPNPSISHQGQTNLKDPAFLQWIVAVGNPMEIRAWSDQGRQQNLLRSHSYCFARNTRFSVWLLSNVGSGWLGISHLFMVVMNFQATFNPIPKEGMLKSTETMTLGNSTSNPEMDSRNLGREVAVQSGSRYNSNNPHLIPKAQVNEYM